MARCRHHVRWWMMAMVSMAWMAMNGTGTGRGGVLGAPLAWKEEKEPSRERWNGHVVEGKVQQTHPQSEPKGSTRTAQVEEVASMHTRPGFEQSKPHPGNEQARQTDGGKVPETTRMEPGLPVLLWHGMGDTCCNPHGAYGLAKDIAKVTRAPVRSVMLGNDPEQDKNQGFFGNVVQQVKAVCDAIAKDPVLQGKHGFHAVGFSQGGQFLRYLVETCSHARVRTLVTLGGQHGGVSAPPGCAFLEQETVQDTSKPATPILEGESHRLCQWADNMIRYGAYLPWVRDHVVQAQYFRDPQRLEDYLEKNIFLPDANNEKEEKNPTYAERMKALERFVMVRFMNDTTVVPRDSSWFAEEMPDGKVVPYSKTQAYAEDWIGLRTLDESSRLTYAEVEGKHLQFSREWFVEQIVEKYLAPTNKTQEGSGFFQAAPAFTKQGLNPKATGTSAELDLQALPVPLPKDGPERGPQAFKGGKGYVKDPMRPQGPGDPTDSLAQAAAW